MSDSYALSRLYCIDTEQHRLQRLHSSATAALAACTTDDNRNCLQARVDVFQGLLRALERATTRQPHPDNAMTNEVRA